MYEVMKSRPFSRTAWMTVMVFMFSIFQPMIQTWALESNFYDGPGGYMENSRARSQVKQIQYLQSERAQDTSKVVGMAIGGAVGGGLVLALGLAASPVLAITTVVGSILAGGFLGDKFGTQARDRVRTRSSDSGFMSWAGGLVGGTLGFMIPGGSVVGAAVGAGIGGAAGKYFADSGGTASLGLSSNLMGRGMERLGGGFMGPMGAMGGAYESRVSLMGTQGVYGDPMWYGSNGMFSAGVPNGMVPYTAYGSSMYSWHDENGDLAYPGYQDDLYRLDGSARMQRTAPDWTLGTGSSSVFAGSSSMGGSIDNPSWGGASSPSTGSSQYGDVYSTYVTSDGETFNPDYRGGERDNLVNLQRRYQDALDELATLTRMNAPEAQRREAHAEVRRLETLLQQRLR